VRAKKVRLFHLSHHEAKALRPVRSLQGLLQFPSFPLLVGEDGELRTPTILDRAQLGLRSPYRFQEARPYRGLYINLPHPSLLIDFLIFAQYSFINIRGNHELIVGDSNELGPQ